jgi:hypothetical protein
MVNESVSMNVGERQFDRQFLKQSLGYRAPTVCLLPYSGKARQKYAGILKGSRANAVRAGIGMHRRRAALHE